jgi:hypothetical protein
MRLAIDWKFALMLVATIAGVATPLWVWKSDSRGHSVHLSVASQTALSPDTPTPLSGLKLSMDGVELDRPFLTSLELVNDGSRPILATDFEDAIELFVNGGAKIARAEISGKVPPDLNPKLTFDEKRIRMNPLLLNPDDQVALSVITSGGRPTFSPRARIAGISSIALETKPSRTISGLRKIVAVGVSFILFFTYSIFFIAADRQIALPMRVLYLGGFASAAGASTLLVSLSDDWVYFATTSAAMAISGLAFATGVLWKQIRPTFTASSS